MSAFRLAAIIACSALVLLRASHAEDSSGREEWSFQKIFSTPISVELPHGGTVISRDNGTPGDSTWRGKQLTLQAWPGGGWDDSIRLDYYTPEASRSGDSPKADEWAYGLSDHTVPDANPQTPWAPPVIRERQGYRVYETARDLTVLGAAVVAVEYNVEIGTKKLFRLSLNCRKAGFKRYAPYYVRIRDSLRLPRLKAKNAK